MITIINSSYRHVIIDMGIFLALFSLPSIAHLFPFPLYLIEPMRIAVFMGYLLSSNTSNAIFLALVIPIFSFFTSGHPVFFKTILISFELGINVGLFVLFFQKAKLSPYLAMLLSIVISKIAYYALKYAFLQFALLKGSWVSTGLQSQLIFLFGFTVLFGFLFNRYFKFLKNDSQSFFC